LTHLFKCLLTDCTRPQGRLVGRRRWPGWRSAGHESVGGLVGRVGSTGPRTARPLEGD
jgi:hypothetical protein